MNTEALNKVLPRLHVQQVYISGLALKVDPEYTPAVFSENTNSLFAWKSAGANFLELTDEAGNKTNFVKFDFDTLTRIVINRTGKPFPENYVPPEGDVIATIGIKFVADYLLIGEEEPDQDGMKAFAANNLPYHIWPYWREHLQSTASRAQLPLPMLPFYRVKAPPAVAEEEPRT